MSAVPGQASRDGTSRDGTGRRRAWGRVWGHAWLWTHRCIAFALALLLVASLGLGGLAWRLAQGPLELPQLARRIEATVNAAPDGPRLAIGGAAIAWGGFHGGTAAPLDIRLRDLRLNAPTGDSQLEVPDSAITLSFRALLRGEIAPATIALQRPRLRAVLTPDGIGFSLGEPPAAVSVPAPATEGTAGEAADPAARPDLLGLLAGLMRPASDRDGWSALRRIRIDGGEAELVDPAAGLRWTLLEPQLDLRRAAAGGLTVDGEAVLRSGTVSAPVRLSGNAQGTPMRLSLGMVLPALRPAELATIWPPLAPLAVLDAPVSLSAWADFDATARPGRMQARLEAGPGALVLGPGRRLPVAGLAATVEGTSRALRVRDAVLRLPGAAPAPGGTGRPVPGGPQGPVLSAQGEVVQREGAWQALFDLTTGPLQASDLPRLWPADLAPEARAAAVGALPSGLLREARARLDLLVPATLDGIRLQGARIGLNAAQAVFDLGQGRQVAVEAAELAAGYTPGALRLERLVLRLPGAGAGWGAMGAAGPTITAEGAADQRDGRWRFQAGARIDAVAAADLARYWPEGLVAGTREWLTRNVTAGNVRNGQWRVEGEEGPGGIGAGSIAVTALTGTAEMSDATVHWLRPVPPIQGVAGTAEFSLAEVTLRARGGRQVLPDGRPGAIELKEGTVRFFALDTDSEQAEIAAQMVGPLPEIFAVLRHPRLKLFEKRKFEVQAAGGRADANLTITFPLLAELPMELLRIRATARVTDARLPGALIDRDVERGNFDVAVDTETLKLSGQAVYVGAPVRLGLEMDFRNGPQSQVTERGTLTGRMDARQINALGIDTGRVLGGMTGVEARYERRRNGQGSVALRGDLRDARLSVDALDWMKPPGTPGQAEGTLRLQGDTLATLDGMRVETQDLALRGRAAFGRQGRLERVEIAEGALGISRFTGEVRRPERDGGPWQVALRGPLADLRPLLGPPGGAARHDAPDESGPALSFDVQFDRGTMGEGRNLFGVQARARTDARGLLREARATGRTGAAAGQGGFDFALMPRGEQRLLRLNAEDGGALLAALDLAEAIRGGKLTVNATYHELRQDAPLTGTAELDQFVLRDAPAAAKLLQAMTLYGLVEALQGGNGLVFSRLVAPFALTSEALVLTDARAFSASLGLTAKGRILRQRRIAAIEGTIVPAYVFNTLLGNLPLIGRLFSPEAGGGLFAATFRVQGPLDDPQVSVNPLAALTPGFLRGLFGLGRGEATR